MTEPARGGLTLAAALSFAVVLGVSGNAYAAFVRGPYPQDLSSRGFALLFELDAAHGAKLTVSRNGAPSAPPAKSVEAKSDAVHELTVTGLDPATTYEWSLALDDGTVDKGTITTAPEDDRAFSFLLYGDNRTNPYAHATLVDRMRKAPGDFLVNTGDMVYDGSQAKEWSTFFAIEKQLLHDRCLFPTIGNHEIAMPTSDGALRYARVFRVPAPIDAAERWYTFRWGSARFFMLDAQDEFSTNERAWLEGALTAADQESGLRWRFVVLHHGPYSSGLHGGNESMLVTRVPELLRQHRVDVVFSGHDHIYERGDAGGLRYIVSGGGGAPLYKQNKGEKHTQKFEAAYHYLEAQVAKDALTITAVRLDGSLLEKCALVAGGASSWSCGEVEATPVAAPLAVGGSAPVAAPSASAPTPVRGKSCGCDLVGATRDWAGLLLVGTLSAGMLLRRTSNPSATRRRRGMIDEDER